MGILPLQFKDGEDAETIGLKGNESFTVKIPDELEVGQLVSVVSSKGVEFEC